MANTDNAFGIVALPPLIHVGRYKVDSSNGTALFKQDVIMVEADGNVAPASAASPLLIGGNLEYLAASTADTRVPVIDDPLQRYVMMNSGTYAEEDRLNYSDHVATAGDTNTKISRHELSDTAASTATGFLILELFEAPDNAVGEFARVRVQIYDHVWGKTGSN